MDRRIFLKVLSATGAGSGLAGCSSGGSERLAPYVESQPNVTPGRTVEYSTVCRECPAGCGMVARVRDGRVHKLEGNPQHPLNRGTLCLRGHTALQDVYHPDRIQGPLARDEFGRLAPIDWDMGVSRLLEFIRAAGKGRVAWIGRLDTGPFDQLVDRWLAALGPAPTRLRYEPFAYETLREAHRRVFGRPSVPDVRFEEAGTLLSFGADFLETWISNVQYSRGFGVWRDRRRRGDHSGRYIFVGPRLSLTGANADEWVPIRPGTQALVARALLALAETGAGGGAASGAVGELAEAAGVRPEVLVRLSRELASSSPSLVLPVGTAGTGEDDTATNEAVARLNRALGNVGRTYLIDWPHALTKVARFADLAALIEAMHAGEIRLLFVHDANPVYHVPSSFRLPEALAKIAGVVSFSSYLDETTSLASLVLPDHRTLESWGTYSPRPGITGIHQPVITSVFDTRSTGDLLLQTAARLGTPLGSESYQEYLRASLGLDETSWARAVQQGGVFNTGDWGPSLDAGLRERAVTGFGPGADAAPVITAADPPVETPPEPPATPENAIPRHREPGEAVGVEDGEISEAEGLILHLYPSLHFFDGRTANRPWAQEIPDPVAKAVWGSWAELHPNTAARLGVKQDDLLSLTTVAGSLQVPALVTDRVHPATVAVQLGQGHDRYTRYATTVGANPLLLLDRKLERPSGALVTSGLPVRVNRLSAARHVVVLQTSGHTVGEPVAREMTLAELRRLPRDAVSAAERDRERPTLRRFLPTGEHHWGMSIDLDRCIGCNACAAACYAENNVPIVGREACAEGREMSWLRIENYGMAVGEDPHRVSAGAREGASIPVAAEARAVRLQFLPMLCQQCNNAPCEYVCPVYATLHDNEGLNQQIYNRCVGTRFCSNNCPYKVRRFQWGEYDFPSPLDQQLNPDVIRRSKGVMEKCTFCVQRIRRFRVESEGEPMRDGQVMTACQQTCPTDAIVFGDLNDETSRVRQLAADPRGYGALAHLNTFPNITYLARVRAEPTE